MPEAALAAAGLPSAEVDAWRASEPLQATPFEAASAATCAHLAGGEALLRRLPLRRDRNEAETRAAAVLSGGARRSTLPIPARARRRRVQRTLTDDLRRAVRDEELVYAAAERFPGLVPTRAEMAPERARPLADKEGIEIAQGLFLVVRACVAALRRTSRLVDAAADARRRSRVSTTSGPRGSPISGARYLERRGRAA